MDMTWWALLAALLGPSLCYLALRFITPGRVPKVGAQLVGAGVAIAELLFLLGVISSGQWGAIVLHLVAFTAVVAINWERLQLHRIFWPPSPHPHELPYTELSQVEQLLRRLARAYPGTYMRARWAGSLLIFIHGHLIGYAPAMFTEQLSDLIAMMTPRVTADCRDLHPNPKWAEYIVSHGKLWVVTGPRS